MTDGIILPDFKWANICHVAYWLMIVRVAYVPGAKFRWSERAEYANWQMSPTSAFEKLGS